MAVDPKRAAKIREQFIELCQKSSDDQLELFLKSFIFALGDDWKAVIALRKTFATYIDRSGEGKDSLNVVQAADFLHKNGIERTAQQRSAEVKDIDLDKNERISFIEYLLLHFKAMILGEFYKRLEVSPVEDLSNNCVGITGVGDKLLDELFTMPFGLSPELEKAIEEFTTSKKEKEVKLKKLNEVAKAGGVKGLAAENEIKQMEASDATESNRIELTLAAAKRKAQKNSGDTALAEKRKKEEAEKQKAAEEARARLAAKKNLWEPQKQDSLNQGVASFKVGALKKTVTVDKSKPVLKAEAEEKK